jgi:hypothetical protein
MTGTMTPLRVQVRCYGKYTFKISDPAIFMRNHAGTADVVTKDDLVEQMRTEVVASFQNVLNELGTSAHKVPVLELPSNTDEIKKTMDEKVFDEPIRNRGIQITGFAIESVTLDDATVYSAFMELKATEDITLKNVTTSGLIYKTNTNAIYKLHADGYVSIRDCTFTPEVAYNGIEIGLGTGLAKSVIIDNCEFDGAFSNNAINIFGMDNGGVVTISNCHFHKLSNILRISNRTNTAWTINLINCTCDEWDTSEYAGMVLFQDYTSGSKEAADANNQFAKITLNIQNCYKPDGTKIVMPDDLSTICSSKDENQIIYMWDAWRNFTEYGDKFPTINII